jgi:Flp pilus assembly protein TadD
MPIFKSSQPSRSTATEANAASGTGHGKERKGIIAFLISSPQRFIFFGLFLIAATFAAYFPALGGGFVWDDDSWTTGIISLLRDTSGLYSIWFQPSALQQYYPLSGTTFWLDYHLWKFWTFPYHVENVLLHASAALLFWQLLLRLRVPGASLASANFALHPVMVQSAAWITERKNVLSMVFYLGALLAYGRYAQWWWIGTGEVAPVPNPSRGRCHLFIFYALAFALFLCALLAKTTTFALPAVILLIGWWKRGQIRWREDVLPSLPFFALSLGLCAITAWLEKTHVGAEGPDFALSFPQRCLVAGRVFWFYLGKLFWPSNLCFVYPHWQPNPGLWWQWLYPATVIIVLLALWLSQNRIGRGPVTALCFYVGTLFPLLGFMNPYGMSYSFVWNHWVYLPSLGIIALAAARLKRLLGRWASVLTLFLGVLTWRQTHAYVNQETLWRDTLAKNPGCWLALDNFGAILYQQGKLSEAAADFREAIRLKPNDAAAWNNLGDVLTAQGQKQEAMKCYGTAIQLKPYLASTLGNLAILLASDKQYDQALPLYQKALQVKPQNVDFRIGYARTLLALGRPNEAATQFEMVLQDHPDDAAANTGLAQMLARQGRYDEAITHYKLVVQSEPDDPVAHNNLGIILSAANRNEEAIKQYEIALRLKPDYVAAHGNLGVSLVATGNLNAALDQFKTVLRLDPTNALACDKTAVVLDKLGRSRDAIPYFLKAVQLNPGDVGAKQRLRELGVAPEKQ